jgi:hypothetical protein
MELYRRTKESMFNSTWEEQGRLHRYGNVRDESRRKRYR